MTSRRFSRQVLLPEVGERGQAAISTHDFALVAGTPELTTRVATLYAEGAGFETPPRQEPRGSRVPFEAKTDALLSVFKHAPSRQVAAGAALVLAEVRSVLAIER